MKEKRNELLEFPATIESFEQAKLFILRKLQADRISKEIVRDTLLVFEALFHNLLEQDIPQDTLLRLSFKKGLGDLTIQLGYEGKMAYLFTDEGENPSPHNRILHAYEEMIGSSYRSG